MNNNNAPRKQNNGIMARRNLISQENIPTLNLNGDMNMDNNPYRTPPQPIRRIRRCPPAPKRKRKI